MTRAKTLQMISETELGYVSCNGVVRVAPFAAILCDEARPDNASAPPCLSMVDGQRQSISTCGFSLTAYRDVPADLMPVT